MSFSSLSLSAELIQALPDDIKTPTEIQSLVIPELLANHNVLALANTGSGKTLAYGLPIVQQLHASSARQQGLILVPTRELATQVSYAIDQIASTLDLHTVCLCGGIDKSIQQKALSHKPDIIVATTGRLLDLANDGTLDIGGVSYLILDEADRLLDMGFWADVQSIANLTASRSQTAMFSATFSDDLKHKASLLMTAPVHIAAHQENSINSDVSESLYLVNKGSKTKALIHLIDRHSWQQVLVFIGAKENADNLTKKLNKAGILTVSLHGDKSQAEREEALDHFKNGKSNVLIATDVLARGIHIDQLPIVVNFELPSHTEVYVHRVGRTARAGNQGMAVSLVCHGEMDALAAIRNLTQRELPLETLDGFPVTDTPSTGENKRAPRDKKANRRSNNKKSIKQFQGKANKPIAR